MKIGQFGGLSKQTTLLLNKDSSAIKISDWSIGSEVSLVKEGNLFFLLQGDKTSPVEPADNAAELSIKLSRGLALWSIVSIKKNKFYLKSVEISDAPTILNLDIGISGKDSELLSQRNEITNDTIAHAVDWFNDEFILDGDHQPRVFVSIYAGNSRGTLELRGKEWVVSLTEVDGFWAISKLTRTKRSGSALRILMGDIKFIDSSVAVQLKDPSHRHALDQAIRSQGDYIQLWTQYSDMEWATKLVDARKLGAISFKGFEAGKNSREWTFKVKSEAGNAFYEKYQALTSKDGSGKNDFTLEVMKKIPNWLDNNQDVEGSGLESEKGRPWLCELKSLENGLMTLRLQGERDRKPPYDINKNSDEKVIEKGIICLSMNGDLKSRERRISAVNSIQQRSNPMPQLHYLLEGVAVPFEKARPIRPSKKIVKSQFSGEGPTSKQKEALKVALNTPDIAVIIGPPGTGKTKVITALQALLAEELKNLPIQHQMLISSFQHDAVDNVIAKSNVFGLPAIKVGGKSSRRGDEGEDPITLWCNSKASSLKDALATKVSDHPEIKEIIDVQRMIAVLHVTKPNFAERARQLNNIDSRLEVLQNEFDVRLSPPLMERWRKWTSELKSGSLNQNTVDNDSLLRHIRALRITKCAFEDDGHIQCIRLLEYSKRIDNFLSPTQVNLLEKLCTQNVASTDNLIALSEIQTQLIDNALPDYRPQHVQRILSEEECELLDDIDEALEASIRNSRTLGYIKILDEYLSALQHSPNAIKKAAESYTSVLGATCQQSASRPMINLKDVEHQNSISFNSVIIDEAARANPLDLLIPMSMGKRRIILVGDHRQLPHLLEPKVEEKLAEKFEFEETHRQMIKKSLFERLTLSLKMLETEKNQPQRVVMLDTQFRMHPLLGRFVSQQFYERYKLDPIKPGFDEAHFDHKVPGYEGKVCGWIEVPSNVGGASRHNGSLQRTVEANIIAKEAKKILSYCPDLSVGVITFYRAQVDEILSAMLPIDLTEKTDNNIQIRPQWQLSEKEDGEQVERLRVGTVDAFQGKEFDVVLLSMVRTLPAKVDVNDDDSLTKAYGFLRLDNRLNVAMSRQHKLLIMVGDPAVATHPAASLAAPSISAFYELCKESHGIIR